MRDFKNNELFCNIHFRYMYIFEMTVSKVSAVYASTCWLYKCNSGHKLKIKVKVASKAKLRNWSDVRRQDDIEYIARDN